MGKQKHNVQKPKDRGTSLVIIACAMLCGLGHG